MQPASWLFVSSGDLIADRRYRHAQDLTERGDLGAAVDLLRQALDRAPDFAAAWFALAELHERAGDGAAAVAAFERARAADPQDRHGAVLRLARLGAAAAPVAMPPAYVRALFDGYAPRFEAALQRLDYRAPELLHGVLAAVRQAQRRPFRFGRVLDLGCGTGLAGAAFADCADAIVGVDLAPAMAAAARRKGVYARVATGDLSEFLAAEGAASAELMLAADVLVYLGDLAPLCRAVARVLADGGLFAFTLETHAGAGVVLGETLRYAHGAAHVAASLAAAGLQPVSIEQASTRTERGSPVPGLVVVAERASV